MAMAAAKCRNPVLRKDFRKKARKARREFDAKVNGRANEESEEWMEEMKAHCERCLGDKDETTLMQEVRSQEQ